MQPEAVLTRFYELVVPPNEEDTHALVKGAGLPVPDSLDTSKAAEYSYNIHSDLSGVYKACFLMEAVKRLLDQGIGS